MLPSEHRMRTRADFTLTTRKGARGRGSGVLLYAAERPGQPTVCGFIVSKAVGNAVLRNRVKRRLRHVFRELLTRSPAAIPPRGWMIVVRAFPEAAELPHDGLLAGSEAAARKALRNAGKSAP